MTKTSTHDTSKPRHSFSDEKWALVEPHIPARKGRPGGDVRLFLDAILWIGTTGSPWRDLPIFFGNWNHVYQRFTYWCDKGHFEAIFNALKKPDMEEIMIDSTSCKAGPSGLFWHTKKRGPQSIGVSRGGLNTKIHAVCDAVGNPLRFKLTPGNLSDVGELPGLIKGMSAKALLADKAYDSNAVVELALAGGMEAIIPSRSNRKLARPLDLARYFARHLVENLFQRMKIFRRVATRFEKLDERFLAFVHIAGIMKWIH